MWQRPLSASPVPAYYFSTYATNKNNPDFVQTMEYTREAHDSNWNWVYFGYSLDNQTAYAYVYFGQSGDVKTLQWKQIAHADPVKKMKFILGSCGPTYPTANGIYYDVRFRYDKFAYKLKVEDIKNYFMLSVQEPKAYKPLANIVKLTECVATFTKDVPEGQFKEFPVEGRGAEEYAIYGWAKWTATPSRDAWHQIFRVTVNEPQTAGDASYYGDRTLSVWVG